jgi:CTD kinase subunit alpha
VAATRDGEIYEIMTQVGEGTFGQVYKARNSQNGSKVALKKIRLEGEKDGFPVTAMREIKLLQSLRHENVVKLHEIMVSKSMFYFYLHTWSLGGFRSATDLSLTIQTVPSTWCSSTWTTTLQGSFRNNKSLSRWRT